MTSQPGPAELISETMIDDRKPDSEQNLQVTVERLDMPAALPDVLSCDGRHIYMRSQRFDLEGKRQDVVAPVDPTEQGGETCYESTLDDCSFENDNGAQVTLDGNSKWCFATADKPGSNDLGDLAGLGSTSISGSATVSGTAANGRELKQRTCSYTLDMDLQQASGGCIAALVVGSLSCGVGDGMNPQDLSVDVCVSAEVSVE